MSDINWNRRKYTKEEFIEAWVSAESRADCARKLGLTIYGATYTTLNETSKILGLNDDHFNENKQDKKYHYHKQKPLEYYLTINSSLRSSALKHKLIKAGLLEEKCNECGIIEWLGDPAPLELDHINGVNNDNRLENLRLLCANCHSQTPTFSIGRIN